MNLILIADKIHRNAYLYAIKQQKESTDTKGDISISTQTVAVQMYMCVLSYVCVYVWKSKKQNDHSNFSRRRQAEYQRRVSKYWYQDFEEKPLCPHAG